MSSNPSTGPPSPTRRRSSFSPGESALSSVFGRSNSQAGTSAMPGNLAANRRRMSISTLGLSGTSPTNTSPWSAAANMGHRRGSISSSGTSASAIDENAVEDGDVNMPSTPFGRRFSFGPRAMAGNSRAGMNGAAGSPTAKSKDAGFTWNESMRSKAETQFERNATKAAEDRAAQRAASIAVVPTQEPPKRAPRYAKPDDVQERILTGQFLMD